VSDGKLQAILDEGRKTRKALPRGLWVVSLVVSAVFVIALAIGLYQSWDVKPLPPPIGSAAPR
jgi:hypothetical protein